MIRRLAWTRTVLLAGGLMLAVLVPTAPAMTHDPANEATLAWLRELDGPGRVLEAVATIDAYESGDLSVQELIDTLAERNPDLLATLLMEWGDIHAGLLMDVVFGQTNGIIGQDADGRDLWFSEAFGADTPEDLATTIRAANAALRGLAERWNGEPICEGVIPLNNQCCKGGASERCRPRTGSRCAMAIFPPGTCQQGSTYCPPTPGAEIDWSPADAELRVWYDEARRHHEAGEPPDPALARGLHRLVHARDETDDRRLMAMHTLRLMAWNGDGPPEIQRLAADAWQQALVSDDLRLHRWAITHPPSDAAIGRIDPLTAMPRLLGTAMAGPDLEEAIAPPQKTTEGEVSIWAIGMQERRFAWWTLERMTRAADAAP